MRGARRAIPLEADAERVSGSAERVLATRGYVPQLRFQAPGSMGVVTPPSTRIPSVITLN